MNVGTEGHTDWSNPIDVLLEMKRLTELGYCPALVFDDSGNWAVSDQGFSSERTCEVLVFCNADYWKSSPEEAMEAYLERCR